MQCPKTLSSTPQRILAQPTVRCDYCKSRQKKNTCRQGSKWDDSLLRFLSNVPLCVRACMCVNGVLCRNMNGKKCLYKTCTSLLKPHGEPDPLLSALESNLKCLMAQIPAQNHLKFRQRTMQVMIQHHVTWVEIDRYGFFSEQIPIISIQGDR